jgi:hypothetical protein
MAPARNIGTDAGRLLSPAIREILEISLENRSRRWLARPLNIPKLDN